MEYRGYTIIVGDKINIEGVARSFDDIEAAKLFIDLLNSFV